MIGLPGGTRIWLAAGITDMRRGMNSLAALVQTALAEDPFICGENRYVAAEHVRGVRTSFCGESFASGAT
jgi:transposase